MNHLTMDTLVSMREPGSEPGQAAAREHLDGCPHCQAELERLHQRVARLKALPTLRPGARPLARNQGPLPGRASPPANPRRGSGGTRRRCFGGARVISGTDLPDGHDKS